MPRFFFHLDYPLDRISDPEGSDCVDLEAARIEARAIIRELLANCLIQDRLFRLVGIAIADEAEDVLARVTVCEAINEILPLARKLPVTSGSGY